MRREVNRRQLLTTVGAVTAAGSVAGCSFSHSSADDRLSMSETVEFDAEEGDEIRVRISSGSGSSDDDDSAVSESGSADVYGPDEELLAELSFSERDGDRASDEVTLTAPTSGTYKLENGDRTVTATIEVDGETVL